VRDLIDPPTGSVGRLLRSWYGVVEPPEDLPPVLEERVLTSLTILGFPALACESPNTRLLCGHNALALVRPPPVRHAIPGEEGQCLIISASHDDDDLPF
jgi:hypothetical protein